MKNTPIKENHLYQKAYAKGKSAPGKYVAVYTLPDRQNHRYVKADPCHRPLNRLGLTTGKRSAEPSSAAARADLCARLTDLSRTKEDSSTAISS